MRKLMLFTIGFTIACALGIYLSCGVWVACVSIIAVASLCFLKCKQGKSIVVVLLGLTVGSFWLWAYNGFYLQAVKQYDGKTITTQIEIGDYSYETDFGVAADGNMKIDGKHYQVRVYLKTFQTLFPGDQVTGEFRLRLTTYHSVEGATYHQGDGIFLLAYAVDEVRVEQGGEIPIQYYPAVLRRKITDIIDGIFPLDTVAFARALLLGDSSKLTYEVDTAFKLSGIRHVVAVSGLHVSILFSLVYFISGRRRVMTALMGIPVLILFGAVAGFTPSVVRASIMQGLMILALLFKKEYDPPTAVAFAVLVMLGINPMVITSVSFQLSISCYIGILLFYQKINTYLISRLNAEKGMKLKVRLLRWVCSSVSITLSTLITTTPFCAWYFGTISLSGILTNLMTLWVISFVFYGIMVACVLAAIWMPAAKAIAYVVAWPVRFILLTAEGMSNFVLSAVYCCSVYIVIWLVLCYVLLAFFLYSKKKRPRSLALCIFAGLVTAISLSWLEPQLDNYRVTVLDVGQGQAILFQCDDSNYLVDCSGDSNIVAANLVAEQLLSQGVWSLDGVILTHYDNDHAGGVMPLLSRIKTKAIYLPDIENENPNRAAIEKQYDNKIIWIQEDMVLSTDQMKYSLFLGNETAKGNESCMSVLFQTENCDILITGDLGSAGEQTLLEKIDLPKLELLVVGHHGAADSTGLPLLNAVKPEVAVISVGKDNNYGHPSDDVLYRLTLFGCRIWRTDLDGTIIFRG